MQEKIKENLNFRQKEIKLLEYKYPNGWDDSDFVLQIGNEKHYIHESLICGHYYPEGSLYYEDDKLLYQNCEKIGEPSYASRGYRLINVVLGIGSIVAVARVLQGYEIERTGQLF